MIDYKATIKNIHSALSDLNIDELYLIVLKRFLIIITQYTLIVEVTHILVWIMFC